MFSGSSRSESTNVRLLNSLSSIVINKEFIFSEIPSKLPLFRADLDKNPIPSIVVEWRKLLSEADAVVICTPVYIHNIPAAIKNALEWIASSGELVGKHVLPITFTPHSPRGKKAMQSLLWSLQALDANVVASLSLYHTDLEFDGDQLVSGDGLEILQEAIGLL